MRWLFAHAADRFGNVYAARLSPDALWAALWFAVVLCALHALRRWRRQPHAPRLAGYVLNQRLYHWGNAALIAVLAASGLSLLLRRPMLELPITWLTLHEWAGLAFALATAFHAVVATARGDRASMWFSGRDRRDLRLLLKNFFGRDNEYPQPGKYDVLQKLYHALLAVLCTALIVSGLVMWLSASRLVLSSRGWVQWSRLAHDVSAVGLMGMIVGHVYFSVIKVNRRNLRDMAGMSVEQEPAPRAAAASFRMAADD
jgi:cytochrome b subunit of formate dehydrogenase